MLTSAFPFARPADLPRASHHHVSPPPRSSSSSAPVRFGLACPCQSWSQSPMKWARRLPACMSRLCLFAWRSPLNRRVRLATPVLPARGSLWPPTRRASRCKRRARPCRVVSLSTRHFGRPLTLATIATSAFSRKSLWCTARGAGCAAINCFFVFLLDCARSTRSCFPVLHYHVNKTRAGVVARGRQTGTQAPPCWADVCSVPHAASREAAAGGE